MLVELVSLQCVTLSSLQYDSQAIQNLCVFLCCVEVIEIVLKVNAYYVIATKTQAVPQCFFGPF